MFDSITSCHDGSSAPINKHDLTCGGVFCRPQENRNPNNTVLCGCDHSEMEGRMIILWSLPQKKLTFPVLSPVSRGNMTVIGVWREQVVVKYLHC
jgi:hypothetical protein